jgi:hypothetical protein
MPFLQGLFFRWAPNRSRWNAQCVRLLFSPEWFEIQHRGLIWLLYCCASVCKSFLFHFQLFSLILNYFLGAGHAVVCLTVWTPAVTPITTVHIVKLTSAATCRRNRTKKPISFQYKIAAWTEFCVEYFSKKCMSKNNQIFVFRHKRLN